MFKKVFSAALALAAGAAMSVSAANAATISFTNWQSTEGELVTPTFTVSEIAGGFEVTIGIDGASDNLGLLSGIFFDLSDDIEESDISFPIAIANFANNTLNVGGGVNLNGLTGDAFDVGFRFAQTSVSPVALVFTVSDLGILTLADWTRVGLRFQTVGLDGELSDKLLSATPVSDVPLPAAAWLMIAGIAGLGAASRGKKAAL